jgi:hypothetical protein
MVALKVRGVYWADVEVGFLPPASSVNPNILAISPSSLVITAGAVQKIVADSSIPRVTDATTSLASQGLRHGWSVTLPNTGGQWASNFTDPFLLVQAVGSSPDEVTATVTMLARRINDALLTLERQAHVDKYNMITTQMSPPSGPQLNYQGGSRKRAAVATFVLGLGATVVVLGLVRRRLPSRGPIALTAQASSAGPPAGTVPSAEIVPQVERVPSSV